MKISRELLEGSDFIEECLKMGGQLTLKKEAVFRYVNPWTEKSPQWMRAIRGQG